MLATYTGNEVANDLIEHWNQTTLIHPSRIADLKYDPWHLKIRDPANSLVKIELSITKDNATLFRFSDPLKKIAPWLSSSTRVRLNIQFEYLPKNSSSVYQIHIKTVKAMPPVLKV
ncbi:hypothetical protein A1F97_11230, partial [Pyrenophora tritici-repentis]